MRPKTITIEAGGINPSDIRAGDFVFAPGFGLCLASVGDNAVHPWLTPLVGSSRIGSISAGQLYRVINIEWHQPAPKS
jgi:hypothetical protein